MKPIEIKKRPSPLRGENGLDWMTKDGLDVGMYAKLAEENLTVPVYLEQMKSESQGELTIYAGKSPDEIIKIKNAIRVTGVQAPLTAFEECFQKAQMIVKGKFSDPMSKFLEYSDIDVLFPAFISDRIHAGMLKTSLVSEFVLGEQQIESTKYEKLIMQDEENQRELRAVAKQSDLPETKIVVGDQTVRLDMYGRYLTMSKIDRRYQRADVFARFMERVGMQIGISQTDLMFYRIINGDGNADTTPETTVTAAASGAGELSLNDAISWALGLPTPYQMSKFVMRKSNLIKWYGRLYDATTTSVTGSEKLVVFPEAVEWDRATITANYAWGVDQRAGLELITTGGGVQTDAEDLVRKVSDGTAIWMHYDFAIEDAYAIAKFDLSS